MPSSPLLYATNTVSNQPAAAAETVIGTITGVNVRYSGQTALLIASCNIVTGGSTTEARLRIRRDSLTGTLVNGPAGEAVPTNSGTLGMPALLFALDSPPGDIAGLTYVLTAAMTAAAGAATVSSLVFAALVF